MAKKLGSAYVNIRANLKPLRTGLKVARKVVTKAMKSIARQTKRAMKAVASAVTKAMSTIYRQIKRAMKAAVIGVTASVWAFARFERQMADVSTMLDDHTMHFMPAYGKAIRKMSVEFGESTKTISGGLYDILSASIAPAKAMGVLKVAMKAAKAGMTDTRTAADAITTILNSYGMEAERASEVSDILFATVKRGKIVFSELAHNIGKVAAMGSIAGLSFEELSAAIATMTRAGMEARLATTAIRSLMLAFIKPGKEAKEAAKKFGFELKSTTLRTLGLIGVLKKLKGATAEQLAEIMPNVRGLAGFAAILGQTTGYVKDLDLMLNATGLTMKAYEKMVGTLFFQLDRLKQGFINLGVSIGVVFEDEVRKSTDRLLSLTVKIVKYLTDNKAALKLWATTSVDSVKKVIAAFWDLVKPLAEVAFEMGTWVVDNRRGITQFATDVIDSLKPVVDYLIKLKDIVESSGWSAALSKIGADIKEAFKITLEIIKPHARAIGMEMAAGFRDAAKIGGKAVLKSLGKIVAPITPIGAVLRIVEFHKLIQTVDQLNQTLIQERNLRREVRRIGEI